MDQSELLRQIEQLFAEAAPATLRETTRSLERLVRQVQDRAVRTRYEHAIDLLPDMVAHSNDGPGR